MGGLDRLGRVVNQHSPSPPLAGGGGEHIDVGLSLVAPGIPFSELAALAVRADRLGYRTLWTNESSAREAFVTLAAWAARTERAEPATGIVPVYVRSPLGAAMAAATLADAAGRPVTLGVGSGHRVVARSLFGTHLPSPLGAVEDYVTIVRGLLAGEQVTHRGSAFSVEGARLGLDGRHRVRVAVAALGPRMTELAARVAEGVLLNWCTPEELASVTERLRSEAGDRFRVAAYVRVAVAADPARARRALADELSGYLRLPAYRAHLERQGLDPEDPPAERLGMAGTPEACRDLLDEYRGSGIDELVVRPVPVDGDPAPVVEAMAP